MKIKYALFALRPQQWIKNLFIFLPLIFGKKLFVSPENLYAVLAFCLFSLASSCGYLINDIFDYHKDKAHPTKRLRPVASGKVSRKEAGIMAVALTVLCLALSFALNTFFGILVCLYMVANYLYTRVLKDIVIVDIFAIAAFFLLRVVAGGIVTDVALSHWIIFLTLLLALFLGFNKRRQELRLLGAKRIAHRRVLQNYNIYFIDQMISVITSSAVIFYALYTVDARTVAVFGTNHLIWTIPFVYYGIFRYLYIVHKAGKEGDPTRILLKDRSQQVNLLLWVAACIFVIYFKF